VGNWKLFEGIKTKHGHGKLTIAGTTASEFGNEEYEGDWNEDKMHGFGTYKFTSGAIYTGMWEKGLMSGQGFMQFADGTKYEGHWGNNMMNGEGNYTDPDGKEWHGIFIDGCFDSKI